MSTLLRRQHRARGPVSAQRRAAVVVIALCVAALVFGLVGPTDDGSSTGLRTVTNAKPVEEALPTCKALGEATGVCRTSTAVLNIVAEDQPLVLDDLELRVQRVRLDRNALVARVRLRSDADRPVLVKSSAVRMSIGGTRVDLATGLPVRLQAGRGVSRTWTFPLRPADRRRLRSSGGGDLALRDGTVRSDDLVNIGVVRLRV